MDRFLISRKISSIEQQPSTSSTSPHSSSDVQPSGSHETSSQIVTNPVAGNEISCAKRRITELRDSSDSDAVDENASDKENRTSDSSSNQSASGRKQKNKKIKKSRTVKKAKRAFRAIWGQDYPWITSRNNKPFCAACQKSLEGGRTHLERHAKTAFHLKRITATSRTVTLDVMAKENPRLKAATESKKSALKLAMLIAEHNLSFKLLEHLPKLLPSLCPDSEIAKQITCSRTKGRGLIVDVLGPQSLEEAALKLRTAKYSLIIDETTDISTSKCLAVVARYFCDDAKEIRDRCLGLLEVPCCTSEALHLAVTEFLRLRNIPLQNMIGFAADNASVMMGNLNGVQAKFRETLPHLFVMGCICHSFHLCASAACLKLPRTIEDLARDVYSYFSHSTKRLVQFAGCQEIANLAPHRLLRPSQTRWLSLQAVVNRILEQWPALIQFFETAVIEDNLQAAATILNALKNSIYKLYFSFLSYVLGLINRLNLVFQSRDSLLYSLLDRVTEVYRTLLKNFIKNEYVEKTPTHAIDPGNVREYKPIEQLYVGARVELEVATNCGHVHPGEIQDFKLRALAFYVELCKEIRRRIKFNDPVLSTVAILNPKVATSGTVPSIMPLALLFPNLVQEQEMEELNSEWRLLPEVRELTNTNLSLVQFINRIGVMKNQAKTLMFPTLHAFMRALACLPHSSAAAERIFSHLNLIKTKTRNKLKVETCNALLLTKELLHTQACYEWNPHSKLFDKTARDIIDSEDDGSSE